MGAPEALQAVRQLTQQRLLRAPEHPLYVFGRQELERIAAHLASGSAVDVEFYQSLRIGLMCVRELRQVDDAYCDLVFALLDSIRPPEMP